MKPNIFSEIAKKKTTLSELMNGREKIETDDIVRDYPNGITINSFDIVSTGEDRYPVVTYAEDDGKYLNGGIVLNKICDGWLEYFHGDIEQANMSLAKAGGVKCVFKKSKTKSGNNITTLDIIA